MTLPSLKSSFLSVSQFIDQLKAETGDERPAAVITWEIGQALRQAKQFDKADQYPDFRDEYLAMERALRPGIGEESWSALKSGVVRIPGELAGTGAALAQFAGANDTAAYLRRKAAEGRAYGESVRGPVSISSYKDIGAGNAGIADTAGDVARYVFPMIGETVPGMAAMIGAGAGAVALAPEALVGSAATAAAALAAGRTAYTGSQIAARLGFMAAGSAVPSVALSVGNE